jgi:IS605 OrfB family transposase
MTTPNIKNQKNYAGHVINAKLRRNKDVSTRTMRLRIKSEAYPWLEAAARETNTVFNWCNETSMLATTRTDTKRKWLSGFDLCNLSAGASEYFNCIGAATIQRICTEFAAKRSASKKLKLRWRVSSGARRSLGWVPFKAASLKRKSKSLKFAGKSFRVFEFSKLEGAKWRDGCFAQDAVGDWWLCLPIKRQIEHSIAPLEAVGIDLGLKTIATTSDGDKLEAGRWTQASAEKLAQAQRHGHKRQVKRIHRRIARQRKDSLHKFTRKIINQYQNIIIGNVSSTKLAKTQMAKSVLDSGWGMLKMQLQYKGQQAGRSVEVVSESYTTRACSECGCLSGPHGLRGLVVREWICQDCGAIHDRDVNAARNILRLRYPAAVCGNESSPSQREPSQQPLRREAWTGACEVAA